MIDLKFIDDETLVNDFIKGNNHMMDVLIKKYQSRVYGYIYSEIGDKTVCNDLFQETFMKVTLSLRSGSYSENGRFASWLLRIAHNLIMDYYRGKKYRHAFSTSLEDIYFEPVDYENSAEDRIIYFSETQKNWKEIIKDMLKELPAEQMEMIIMKIYEDKTHKEIAKLKNISINTSLGRYRYAIINLRKIIAKNKIDIKGIDFVD